jgi:protein O-mannosyl-transferase
VQKTTSIIKFIPILILLLVSCAVYFNALSGNFVYDDTSQIVDNPWITNIRNIVTIFSKSVWSFQPGAITNYYRPLMHMVYMLNYHIFGLKPWGFHLVNILFHCGVSVLVFLVIRRFLTEQRVTTSSVYLSPPFIAAMLFALHPIHTEAVTWIAGLPDVAFTFFYLLSFYFFIRSKAVRSGSYLFSVVSFAIAAFFKEPALTLPVVLFAYDYVFQKDQPYFPDYVKRYVPYLVIAVGYLALRIHALGGFAPAKMLFSFSTEGKGTIKTFPE